MTGRVTPKKGVTVSKPSTAGEWKRASRGTPVVVPSGLSAYVKPLGMDKLMAGGIIPNSLMQIMTAQLQKGKPPTSDKDLLESMDEEKVLEIIQLFDTVTIAVMVEPKVHPAPREEEERDDDLLYVDEISFEDKIFLFQYAVGGTRDLETFRKELPAFLATVPDVQGDVVSPEPADGAA